MSWFDTAGIASFAKSALTTAQKTIDKALDIQEEKESKDDKVSKVAGMFPFLYFSCFLHKGLAHKYYIASAHGSRQALFS